MAELITTDEEKAAASYLDWDDASLGRFAKHLALKMKAVSDDADGVKRMITVAAATHLVNAAAECNAGFLTIDIEGAESGDKKTATGGSLLSAPNPTAQ